MLSRLRKDRNKPSYIHGAAEPTKTEKAKQKQKKSLADAVSVSYVGLHTVHTLLYAGTDTPYRHMTQPWVLSLFFDCEHSGMLSWLVPPSYHAVVASTPWLPCLWLPFPARRPVAHPFFTHIPPACAPFILRGTNTHLPAKPTY